MSATARIKFWPGGVETNTTFHTNRDTAGDGSAFRQPWLWRRIGNSPAAVLSPVSKRAFASLLMLASRLVEGCQQIVKITHWQRLIS